MFTHKFFEKGNDAKCFFRGYGSFGEINGELNRNEQELYHETDDYKINCTYKQDKYGVISRKDSFTNKSNKPLEVNCLKSRFVFEGGEYQVYTQFNNWQTESMGNWQPLVTSVSAVGGSSRTTQDATPFMVLWSEQAQRGVAFCLVPDSAWEIKVTKAGYYSKYTKVIVELGILDYNFDMVLNPSETINMPEIICYEIRNKVHMGCYKLHNYLHNNYPRRQMPVIYNTWMYRFDHITYENLSKQISLAANIGAEYYVIDAGWFGKGADWSNSVGDWSENTTGALCGRMIDIANEVRAAGMKFGLWLEPERATPESDSVKEHPEYYIPGDVESEYCFLDFANSEAREWMLSVIFDLIEKYGIEYIKDDYNADMYFDVHHTAFLKYHQGHAIFIKAIREKYPDIYITSCASGGERMEIGNYIKFDSFWPSDNESPYDEMRIYKETILRLPPQAMERWVAVHSLKGLEHFYEPFGGSKDKMVACGDAIWQNVVGVQPSFMEGYMTCGPIGISCNLELLSDEAFAHFKEYIEKIKKDRDFWKSAVARIICDTPTITTYQYSDMELSKIVIQMFTHKTQQDHFAVYPEVCENKNYILNGDTVISGKEIAEQGIDLSTPEWHDNWNEMLQIELEAV
ncbi:MAG: alpha-galactosidase [Clostridia bacterium]|nr:alpha-galactosidase [Clostridia bacterium]